MKIKGNNLNKLFLLFLIVAFFLGLYMYAFGGLSKLRIQENIENLEDNINNPPANCPDLLINKGDVLLLYNTKTPEEDGKNPIPFYNLDEYINYLEIQRKNGSVCPILYLQKENDTQGKDIYRVRPSPFDQQGGLPLIPLTTNIDPKNPVKILDANRDNPPYNSGNYYGFDPMGLHIGQFTEVDKVHESTTEHPLSDNPMDFNWGGVLYTHQSIENGNYEGSEVTKPKYLTPKGTIYPDIKPESPFPPYPST